MVNGEALLDILGEEGSVVSVMVCELLSEMAESEGVLAAEVLALDGFFVWVLCLDGAIVDFEEVEIWSRLCLRIE